MKYDLSDIYEYHRAVKYLQDLRKKENRIVLKAWKPSRTNQQNRYFHAALKILGDEFGYTIEEMKIVLYRQLDFMIYTKNENKFLKSSADLNKLEFITLIDYTRSFGDEHGCYIPTPDEYYDHQFEIEKELKL